MLSYIFSFYFAVYISSRHKGTMGRKNKKWIQQLHLVYVWFISPGCNFCTVTVLLNARAAILHHFLFSRDLRGGGEAVVLSSFPIRAATSVPCRAKANLIWTDQNTIIFIHRYVWDRKAFRGDFSIHSCVVKVIMIRGIFFSFLLKS